MNFLNQNLYFEPIFHRIKDCPICQSSLYIGYSNKVCMTKNSDQRFHFSMNNMGEFTVLVDSHEIYLKIIDGQNFVSILNGSVSKYDMKPTKTDLTVETISKEYVENLLLMI